MSFVPDASLPDAFYYQSTRYAWPADDERAQRINLFPPIGVSTLRFGVAPLSPLATILARNDTALQASVPGVPNGTTTVGVLFSPNGAEEDYVGPTNYTYHDEPLLLAVLPAGAPIHGG